MITRHDTTTRSDLEIIEALDFEHEPGCEHSLHASGRYGHGGPAWALVKVHPPCRNLGCNRDHPPTLYVCQGGWEFAFQTGFRCRACGHDAARDEVWTILAYVNAGQ